MSAATEATPRQPFAQNINVFAVHPGSVGVGSSSNGAWVNVGPLGLFADGATVTDQLRTLAEVGRAITAAAEAEITSAQERVA